MSVGNSILLRVHEYMSAPGEHEAEIELLKGMLGDQWDSAVKEAASVHDSDQRAKYYAAFTDDTAKIKKAKQALVPLYRDYALAMDQVVSVKGAINAKVTAVGAYMVWDGKSEDKQSVVALYPGDPVPAVGSRSGKSSSATRTRKGSVVKALQEGISIVAIGEPGDKLAGKQEVFTTRPGKDEVTGGGTAISAIADESDGKIPADLLEGTWVAAQLYKAMGNRTEGDFGSVHIRIAPKV